MEIQHYHSNNTQVILTVPIINGDDNYAELYEYLSDYAMFATHVKLTFEYKNNRLLPVEFLQLQKINPKWKNHTSIYYYDKKEFSEFILGLDDNDSIVYDVLYSTFREGSNMHKSVITQMTIGQLKRSPIGIDRLYDEL